jgi:pyruvate-formate lyase-activating enzyme
VLETLKTVRRSNAHLEITMLVIPGENDDANEFKQMVDWLANELGEDTFYISVDISLVSPSISHYASSQAPRVLQHCPPTPSLDVCGQYRTRHWK